MFQKGDLIVYGNMGVCRVEAVEAPAGLPGAGDENTLTLIVTDGTKGMFELSGAVSDRNVRFADMIFDGAFR